MKFHDHQYIDHPDRVAGTGRRWFDRVERLRRRRRPRWRRRGGGGVMEEKIIADSQRCKEVIVNRAFGYMHFYFADDTRASYHFGPDCIIRWEMDAIGMMTSHPEKGAPISFDYAYSLARDNFK